ncbi:MAG: threonine-phosphate decarboxylase [Clostridia bacterium]|nr:threonine-phosphate decarboxylase [Clostridia bacterium]
MVDRGIVGGSREIEPAVHGGNWQEAALLYGYAPEDMLDFSTNINPLGPPAAVLDCLHRNLNAIQRYPDPESFCFRTSLAAYLGVGIENVLAGNGAVEIIYLLLQTLRPRRVLIVEPTFSEYRRTAQIAGAEITTILLRPQDGFHLDPAAFLKNLSGLDLAFLCNPNNPTGNLISSDILQDLAEACYHQGVFLVVDESFLDFLPDWSELTLCRRAAITGNLLVLRSLTKFFALPGLRLGAAVTSSQLVSRLHRARDPWSVNILAQMAGEVALKEYAYMERSRDLIRQEKEYLFMGLVASGLKPFPAAANFILVDISASGWTSPNLAQATGQRGILIRDCSSFPGLGPDYIRLAVKDRAANATLLRVLEEIL